jgi:hypothetical protein
VCCVVRNGEGIKWGERWDWRWDWIKGVMLLLLSKALNGNDKWKFFADS